jgi:CheY-like chemotaxis protein
MTRVRIVHWKPAEAEALVETCRAGGFEVEFDATDLPLVAKTIRRTMPDALVIDLTRMPSYGRELAFAIRRTKYTRQIPIVFVDGEPEKVEAIRRQLPDAVFASRKQLCARIKAACGRRIPNPVTPPGVMERYASRSKAQKLGIKEGSTVALFDAPRDYAAVLGELPAGVELVEDPDDVHPVTLWFVRDPREYQAGLRRMRTIADRTKLWVVWRKGSTDGLTSNLIREAANEAGLVDYKICAVSSEWSGMVFARRKKV